MKNSNKNIYFPSEKIEKIQQKLVILEEKTYI